MQRYLTTLATTNTKPANYNRDQCLHPTPKLCSRTLAPSPQASPNVRITSSSVASCYCNRTIYHHCCLCLCDRRRPTKNLTKLIPLVIKSETLHTRPTQSMYTTLTMKNYAQYMYIYIYIYIYIYRERERVREIGIDIDML